MAATELSTLGDSGVIQDADLLPVVRAGAGKKAVATRFVTTNAAGNSAIRGSAVLPSGQNLMSLAAPLVGGDGGTNTFLYSGSTGLAVRNAANSASLLTVTNAGAVAIPGSLTVAGSAVWHAGNFNPSSYMPVAGGTFTGNVNVAGAAYKIDGLVAITSGGGWINNYSGGAGGWRVINLAGNAGVFTVSDTGNGAFNGTLNAAGAITQNGSQVWHAGNFAPSNYAALAGATFTAAISAPQVNVDGQHYLGTSGGNPLHLFGADDYLIFVRSSNTFQLFVDGGARMAVAASGVTVSGTLSASGAITQGGNQVWHAGNFNPSSYLPTSTAATTYAALAGANFTGAVTGTTANFTGGLTAPTLTLAAGITLSVSGGRLLFSVGGNAVASIDASGNLKVLGSITASTTP